jgi:OFA family oxalate/formate antiporter-like MFS transporter
LFNGLISAGCLFVTPMMMESENVTMLFVVIGVAFWQYGGGLALMPAWTADYYGSKNLGLNYGLVFIGWGIAFFVPQLAGYIKDRSGKLDGAFYLSGSLLVLAVVVSLFLRKELYFINFPVLQMAHNLRIDYSRGTIQRGLCATRAKPGS